MLLTQATLDNNPCFTCEIYNASRAINKGNHQKLISEGKPFSGSVMRKRFQAGLTGQAKAWA
jgi:hypothetical protein